ncbi:MAG: Arc family DNA binding domain-containing protein [Bdellovibrionales bacterium RIFCSPHIGHO2_01_FULL_40_29]|nr:MAG: Arc family DNA binding domain-containing protein [Bdellovibrionales bacterium RIFCSPHIGHO2_01_FULL_40_29]OFZ33729.1 MAG: Arc family DNA binding domain-containing protein [Bdellovibrionales bacterium RIFCSPHIGHO2_02_FULL_40_15]
MSGEKKPFLLRVNADLLEAYQKWSDDELRSLNGQLDYVLRKALRESGRVSVNKDTNLKKTEKKETKK